MKKQYIVGIISLLILLLIAFLFLGPNKQDVSSPELTTAPTLSSEEDSEAKNSNPLQMSEDGGLTVAADFVLKPGSTASENVLDCFATTLEDLQAQVAWSSNTSGEGVFCNMVFQRPDSNGALINVVKEYSIPGSFQVIKSPYVTALFGPTPLVEGASYSFPEKVSFSNGDIVIGGKIGDSVSILTDQFGAPASEQDVTVTVYNLEKTYNEYDTCISFTSHYSSLSYNYGLYEHTWCDLGEGKYGMVARELLAS